MLCSHIGTLMSRLVAAREASQRLGILRKFWRVFHDDHFLRDASGVLSCPFWSTVLQCGARLPIHTLHALLDSEVSGTRFLTGGVLECDIAHRRSVAVQCMLYKIRCNSMHWLRNALPVWGNYHLDRMCQCWLHAVPWSHIGIIVRRFVAEPGTMSHWNGFADPVFDGVELAVFKSRDNGFLMAKALSLLLPSTIFPFLFFLSIGWHCAAGVYGLGLRAYFYPNLTTGIGEVF